MRLLAARTECLADQRGATACVRGRAAEPVAQQRSPAAMAGGHALEELGPLLERLERRPQRGLDRAALLDDHRLLRVAVADAAGVAQDIPARRLPERAVALRARERARRTVGPVGRLRQRV